MEIMDMNKVVDLCDRIAAAKGPDNKLARDFWELFGTFDKPDPDLPGWWKVNIGSSTGIAGSEDSAGCNFAWEVTDNRYGPGNVIGLIEQEFPECHLRLHRGMRALKSDEPYWLAEIYDGDMGNPVVSVVGPTATLALLHAFVKAFIIMAPH